ncbi:MAG: hypothetical protein K6A68_07695 [Clostridiales bacterium]|nr:hypothetical protein [Clostridia bacterium]MCR4883437.1 hypothetical protein [Clostridiales bacterium]
MIRIYEPQDLPVNRNEILRYALIKPDMPADRIDQLLPDALQHIHGRVCYASFPVQLSEDGQVDLSFTKVSSRSLCHLLRSSSQCILFAATIGIDFDRYAARISRLSTTNGWLLHAIGTERIETLCDTFEKTLLEEGCQLTRRFSPGYGDVPLSMQRDVFRALDCSRKIGLTLTDSLLMSPSKSVTAIIGLTNTPLRQSDHCASCSLASCAFRSISHEKE